MHAWLAASCCYSAALLLLVRVWCVGSSCVLAVCLLRWLVVSHLRLSLLSACVFSVSPMLPSCLLALPLPLFQSGLALSGSVPCSLCCPSSLPASPIVEQWTDSTAQQPATPTSRLIGYSFTLGYRISATVQLVLSYIEFVLVPLALHLPHFSPLARCHYQLHYNTTYRMHCHTSAATAHTISPHHWQPIAPIPLNTVQRRQTYHTFTQCGQLMSAAQLSQPVPNPAAVQQRPTTIPAACHTPSEWFESL